jgi:hypothetical protein
LTLRRRERLFELLFELFELLGFELLGSAVAGAVLRSETFALSFGGLQSDD